MNVTQTTQFKKDVKRQRKRGRDLGKPKEGIALLVSAGESPASLRDHALGGNYTNEIDLGDRIRNWPILLAIARFGW